MPEPEDAKAEALAKSFDALLQKHGVPVGEIVKSDAISTICVGCSWCKYSLAFDVTLPKAFAALIPKIQDAFKGYKFDSGDWSHLGVGCDQYLHLTAWVN